MTKARDLANVISGSGTLNAAVIPNLAASKITSGTFANARLSSGSVTQHVDLTALSASNLTSGTVPSARLSLGADDVPSLATSKITSGTFADARFAASNITQHVDLSNLSASNLTSGTVPNARITLDAAEIPDLPTSKITSGTFDNARVSSGSVTQHVSATTNSEGTWSPSYGNFGGNVFQARYAKVGRLVHISLYGRRTSHTATDNLASIGGLPFTSLNGGNPVGGGQMNADLSNNPATWFITPNSGTLYMRIGAPGSSRTITSASSTGNLRGHDMAYVHYFIIQGTYIAAS